MKRMKFFIIYIYIYTDTHIYNKGWNSEIILGIEKIIGIIVL